MFGDVVYLSRETVEDVLANYFGLTIPEAEQYGLNKTLAYFPDTDRYYCCLLYTSATALSAEEIDFCADLLEQKASSEGFPGNNSVSYTHLDV